MNKKCWRVSGNTISVEVTSTGWSGQEWVDFFNSLGCSLGDGFRQLLLSPSFEPTSGLTYRVVILKQDFEDDNNRTVHNACVRAEKLGLKKPQHLEVACLLRRIFSDEDLNDLRTFVILFPLNEQIDGVELVAVDLFNGGGRLLEVKINFFDSWFTESAVAFVE